jgi:ATP-dependent exoDNAse (exonuclease V) alpha subunit
MRRILRTYPHTTMLAVTRRGAAELNKLALQVKYPRRPPLATLSGDIESNPENYAEGKLLPPPRLQSAKIPVHKGMKLYLRRNVQKNKDFVNGMQCVVEAFNEQSRALQVMTITNHRVVVYPWTDAELGNRVYYPVRLGWASTVLKFQGAELEHVTLYLDSVGAPGAAYTGMSRVQYGRDCLIGGRVTRHHFAPAR